MPGGPQGIDHGAISGAFQQQEADMAWITQEQGRHQAAMTSMQTVSQTQTEDAKTTREAVQGATKPT
jgi:hypothetical protein